MKKGTMKERKIYRLPEVKENKQTNTHKQTNGQPRGNNEGTNFHTFLRTNFLTFKRRIEDTPSMHHPRRRNVSTSMVRLKKKNGHVRKTLTQNGEPQRYSTGTQKKKKKQKNGKLHSFEAFATTRTVFVCLLGFFVFLVFFFFGGGGSWLGFFLWRLSRATHFSSSSFPKHRSCYIDITKILLFKGGHELWLPPFECL